jgi:HD-GYP domain-containing protein (c-di-GMP phosphodiesterase class II)
VGVSLGIATYPDDAQSLGKLIETADAHLYASKQRGGNALTGSSAEQVAADSNTNGLLGVAGRLLNVVGARDHYTRLHSEHVVLYALSLVQAAGLSDESLSTLHVAAMLHDVGKIGVPAQLLRQPTALTPAEEDMVRRHVDMSASVIEDMHRLAEVADAVRSHHERQDGSGYPAELSGDDIPVLARILAIADAYAAMTLDRPYREPMTHEQARAELVKAAGTQFDPHLVRQFIQILEARDARVATACAKAV